MRAGQGRLHRTGMWLGRTRSAVIFGKSLRLAERKQEKRAMNRKLKIPPEGLPYGDCGREMSYPQGLKWTKQRKSVYRALWETAEPLSAMQIYQRLSVRGDTEDSGLGEASAISTVYRILAAFEEKGLVEKSTWTEDGTAVYGLNRGGHTHYAVCLKCHSRIPLQGCPFSHIHLEEAMGDFTVTGHKLELYGYCRNCREG